MWVSKERMECLDNAVSELIAETDNLRRRIEEPSNLVPCVDCGCMLERKWEYLYDKVVRSHDHMMPLGLPRDYVLKRYICNRCLRDSVK